MDNPSPYTNAVYLIGYLSSLLREKGATESELRNVEKAFDLSQTCELENFPTELKKIFQKKG